METSIFDILMAPWKTAVINTAVRLKIFTVLQDQSMTAEEIAFQTRADDVLLRPILNALAGMGLLRSKDDEFKNTHLSSVHFIEGNPFYVGDFIQLLINEVPQWEKLYSLASKQSEVRNESEEAHRIFIKGMQNFGMLGEVEALVHSVDFSGCKLMIDAGGGSGIYSVALCQKYPDLKSIILDRQETLAITKELISSHKESDRVELRECDITKEDLGDGVDAVLLSDVVYDATEAQAILKNAWHCLCENGQLILRGYYTDPEGTNPLFGALFVINQLVFDANRKIVTLTELNSLLTEIGFTQTKVSPLTERSTLITAIKMGN